MAKSVVLSFDWRCGFNHTRGLIKGEDIMDAPGFLDETVPSIDRTMGMPLDEKFHFHVSEHAQADQ